MDICYAIFIAWISWLGDVRNNIVFLNPLLRLSIVSCLLFVLKLYGYEVFLRSLGILRLLLHLFMLRTLVLFRLPPILFFMNVPSTLRLIFILFETPWKVGWYLFLASFMISKGLMSSPKLWLDNNINLLLANCCWLTYQHQFKRECYRIQF